MLRQTRLNPKRATPRRDEGRVQHGRMKEKAGAAPTAEEKRHMDRVAGLPCLVCGVMPVTLHHVSSDGTKRIARSHKLVTPLCPRHHLIQHGPRESVEALGHAGFYREHWVHLLVEAERLWAETVAQFESR